MTPSDGAQAPKTSAKPSRTPAKRATARRATAKPAIDAPEATEGRTVDRAEPDRAEPDRAEPDRAEPNRAAGLPAKGAKPTSASRGALAAGAARASGERRRRSGTPLLSTDPIDVSAARRALRTTVPEPALESAHTPPGAAETTSEPEVPDAPRRRPTRGAIRSARRPGGTQPDGAHVKPQLRAVPTAHSADPGFLGSGQTDPGHVGRPAGPGEPAQRHTASTHDAPGTHGNAPAWLRERAASLVDAALEGAEFSSEARPGPAEFVELAVNVLRSAVAASGVPTDEVEAQVAQTLAYVRRRLTGDYTVDEFGFDEDYTLNVHLPLLRPLYKKWFRVEVKGIENIPTEGGALVVANHSGTVPLDSMMTQLAVHDEHPAHRHLRMLGADLVFKTPFVGTIARRSGSTLAANTDAERLLNGGHLVGVWPEGFKGVGKPYSERYKLQRFGRGGFVSAALRTGAPIVPCSIVGAEEIYPILGNLPTVARLLGLPYAPITPTFPLLGPLGLIPLPSKWLIEFGPPIDTASFGPDAADDPMLVFDLTDQVRETIQQTLYSLLMQRKSVFL